MSLRELVAFLIRDDDGPVLMYHRAARLFEFQVSLFYQRSFTRLLSANNTVIAPTLKRARALATVKILQKLETDIKEKRANTTVTIRDLAEDENYRCIFDDLFLPNSGWDQIVDSISQRAFDKSIAKRCEQAQTAANIIDFSYRFSKNPLHIDYHNRRNPGGLESARYVVRHKYRPSMSDSKIRGLWGAYSSAAIFLYLLLSPHFDLRPPSLGSHDFLDRLLQQTKNLEMLRRYFRAYHTVQAALSGLHYMFPPLELAVGGPQPELSAPFLSAEMEEAFSAWILHG